MKLIVASDLNGVIGNKNAIPWYIPEDLAYFKEQTMGDTVIMGRKTSDSLPPKFNGLLPGRRNIIISRVIGRNSRVLNDHLCNAWTSDVKGLLMNTPELDWDHTWVIGGASIYETFLPVVKTIHLTEVDKQIAAEDADTYFKFDRSQWTLASETDFKTSASHDDNGNPYRYRHLVYVRK